MLSYIFIWCEHSPSGDHIAPDWPSDQLQTSNSHVNSNPFGLIIHMVRSTLLQGWARGLTLRVITETGVILLSGDQFFHVDVIEKW